MSVTLADIHAARQRLRGGADATPPVAMPHMSGLAGRAFLMKLELAQPIGAFKPRGAHNAVALLPEGVVCCSTGNHGRGVARAAGWPRALAGRS